MTEDPGKKEGQEERHPNREFDPQREKDQFRQFRNIFSGTSDSLYSQVAREQRERKKNKEGEAPEDES